jgi:hypothetical protein
LEVETETQNPGIVGFFSHSAELFFAKHPDSPCFPSLQRLPRRDTIKAWPCAKSPILDADRLGIDRGPIWKVVEGVPSTPPSPRIQRRADWSA